MIRNRNSWLKKKTYKNAINFILGVYICGEIDDTYIIEQHGVNDMSQSRTVSNGRDFSQAIKRAIIGGGKFCVCCKRERATQVDHIHALQFGGSSDIDNATALCGRCHFEKSRAEANADTAQQVERIVRKFQKLTFTPGGKRRTIKPGRDTEAAQWARKILRAKRQGNHKLAAKLRRDAKAAA